MSNINDYGLPFTSQDGDRKYSALEWREYFSRLIHNGLIQNAANECQVKPQAAPNKTVYVDTGVVFINGAMRVLDAPITLAVAENTSGNPRIDRVVARLNEASRTIEFAVLEGAPAGSPVAPALTRTAGVYELGLADIILANGYSTITAAEIVDQRWDVSLCGASSMTIGVIPPSGLQAETVTLSPETTGLFGVGNVDEALKRAIVDFSSYQMFCANVNATSLDCAFGKNNVEFSKGLGLQLALYAWFKGDSKITYPFTNLIKCHNVNDIKLNADAILEIITNSNIISLIQASPFAYAELKDVCKITIYSNGDENIAITGGILIASNATASKQSDHIAGSGFNGGKSLNIITNNDLGVYKLPKIRCKIQTTGYTGASGDGVIYLGSTTTKANLNTFGSSMISGGYSIPNLYQSTTFNSSGVFTKTAPGYIGASLVVTGSITMNPFKIFEIELVM